MTILYNSVSFIQYEEIVMPFIKLVNYSEDEIFEKIIIPVFNQYPEAKWFAADNVAITHEDPKGNPGPGWTTKLSQANLITAPQPRENEINKYVELERMLSSIVYFNLFYDGSDEAYTKLISQQSNDKLTKQNFHAINQLMRKVAQNNIAYDTLVTMLVYSDLGKAPQARFKASQVDSELDQHYPDHDDFIEAVLNRPIPDILKIIPSYFKLPKESKTFIANTASAMKIHLGHVLHIEGGEKMFEKFLHAVNANKVNQAVLDFAFAIQIADVAASAGQVTNAASLAFTDSTCKGYLLVKEVLQQITEGVAPKQALHHYLQTRAQWLELDMTDSKQAILARLGCMLRYYTPEAGQKLLVYAQNLDANDWNILCTQFIWDGGFNNWQRNPTYLPAVLLNIVKAGKNPVEAAVGIAKLFERYAQAGIAAASSNPLCLNTLAGIATKEPDLFSLKAFNVEQFAVDEQNNVTFQSETTKAILNKM